MKIGVLGPLSIHIDGRSVTPTACKPRKALALLAVRGNQFVSFADLVEELWDEAPPHSVRVTLQSYIARLRGALGGQDAHESDRLSTEHDGYRLRIDPGALDADRFEAAAARAEQAWRAGNLAAAAQGWRAALAVWRGPALTDVHIGRLLSRQTTRLAESRLTVLEQLVEAELWLGRHRELLGELTGLVAEHPFHESLHAQLMTALYRSARRQQSLEVYHELRARLDAELGLDPSPRIQDLHRAILVDDPALAHPAASSHVLNRRPVRSPFGNRGPARGRAGHLGGSFPRSSVSPRRRAAYAGLARDDRSEA